MSEQYSAMKEINAQREQYIDNIWHSDAPRMDI